MQITKKLAAIGAGAGLFAALVMAVPFAGSASARAVGTNDFGTNNAVDVQTELNCTTHTLSAKVTNKTSGSLSPDVTFNTWPPSFTPPPIGAGQTVSYYYNYSGNNLPVSVEVSVDTYAPIKLNPMLSCSEPVSFMVTEASQSAVAGMLTNNSTFVAQVVITQAMGGGTQVENLQPGESRFVALPYKGYPNQKLAFVNIGTTNGFQSSYTVDLEHPSTLPPLPLPTEVQ